MRADKLVMLGVGAMGLYVVYRMFKTDGKAAQTTALDAGVKTSVPVALPDGPRLDPRQVLNGETLLMKAGTMYRLRLNLAGGLDPLGPNSTDAAVKNALLQLGFSDATVFRQPLPTFPVDATQNITPDTRFVVAVWGKTTMSVPRPKAVELIWQTKVPTA